MKLHLLLIALTLATFTGLAQTTAIPDANFEQALIDLGIDTNGLNGNILNADAAGTTGYLDVSSKNISDLTGVEVFTAITGLFCWDNQLTSIDISNNTALTSLNLGKNLLTTLDVSNNIALTQMRVVYNQLTSLDVSQNTLLTNLTCDSNQLTSLNVKNGNNSNFTNFDASSNPNLICIEVDDVNYSTTNWTSIDAVSNFSTDCALFMSITTPVPDANFEQALIDLGIDSNGLNGNILNADALGVIGKLDVRNKNISSLAGIEAFTKMTELWCFGNQLTSLNISQNISLTILYAFDNQLTSLDVTQNVNLINLQCGSNQLTSLDISNNTLLTTLGCATNLLTNIDITQNVNLTNFICSYNQLTSINTSQNTALTVLECDFNQLTSIDISQNTDLVSLNVENNQLASLDITQNTALFTLFCPFNSITSLDLSKNIALSNLSCYNNQLTSLDISQNTALTRLECANNQLASLNLTQNLLLDWLRCQFNQLVSLDVSLNTALTYFDCSYNNLTGLNVKNGNNTNITYFNSEENPNLACINVDNIAYSTSNWTTVDPASSFSENCANINDLTVSIIGNGSSSPSGTTSYLNGTEVIVTATPDFGWQFDGWSGDATGTVNPLTITVDANKTITATFSSPQTYVPGDNFEQALIDLGYDSGPLNDYVPTVLISGITNLSVVGKSITNLSGIGDFTSLVNLNCSNNQLSGINLSQNIALTTLDCGINQITDIVLSANINLVELHVYNNLLSTLNVDQNIALETLTISSNPITVLNLDFNVALMEFNSINNDIESLDLSKNSQLSSITCRSTALKRLNVKNGNNINIATADFNTINSIFLECVEVDDVAYSTTNWTNINAGTNFSLDCLAGSTAIPDANFEQALIDLGIDSNGLNGSILNTDAAGVTGTLDVSIKNITDLTGIEAFTAITNLACSNNQLTSLDISNNAALTSLDCSSNLITSIDVSNNPELVTFFCFNNAITNLDLSNNPLLTLLNGYSNQLSNITFSANPTLNWISVSDNLLTSLDLSQAPTLAYLNCFGNQLESLNVKNGNNVNFTIFDASSNPNLLCIQVDDVSYSTTNWTNIDTGASFSINCLGSTAIPDANFEQALIDLGIDSNGLNGNILNSDAAAITGTLNVSSKSIANLAGIEAFTALEKLICYGNQLSTLDLSKNTLLTFLNCNSNNLTSLDLSANTVLNNLGCSANQLSSLNLSNNPLVTMLFLSSNNLTTLDLSNNLLLNQITISDNQLSNLDLTNNLALTHLICESNQLASIDVSQNPNLLAINFNDNLLTNLDLNANPSLISIVCSNNLLTSLNVKSGNNSTVTNFDATNNPNLTCIKVDDASFSTTNWTNIDAGASFSLNCQFDDDGDGVSNDQEVTDSTDPNDGCSYFTASQVIGNVTATWNSLDCDCDGTSNGDEIIAGTNPQIVAPTGDASQSFCGVNNPTMADLSATGTSIQWYAASTGGSALLSTDVLTDATTYYASQTVGSCESGRFEVAVTVTTAATPTGSAAQSFCPDDTPTIADLAATGTAIQWYAAATGGTVLATTDALTDATTYYASQTVGSCESDRLAINVTIGNIAPPTGEVSQIFCFDDPTAVITIAQLEVIGTNIQWYATTTGGTPLISTTTLVKGTNYYASQTVTGCESERFKVTASNNERIPPTGGFTQMFCKEENATVADLVVEGTNVQWHDAVTGGNIISATDALVSDTYYASQTINGCESYRMAATVRITDPELPSSTATQSFCATNNPAVADLVATATGTDIYWYTALTGGTALALTEALTSGNYYVGQIINNCESPRLEVTITVNSPDEPSAENSQVFCINDNPSVADLVATGSTIRWFESQESETELDNSTTLQTISYFVSQTVDGCESPRLEVAVTVDETACEIVTGLLHSNQVNISTYPSPTNGNLQIDLGKKYHSIKLIIRDVEGTIIENSTYTATDKIQVQLNGAKGVYIVQILVENNILSTMRVLKN